MKTILLVLLSLMLMQPGIPQEVLERIKAVPTKDPIRIDGVLDEQAWDTAPSACDFIQRIPYNGKPSVFPADVRFLYDNSGLYVGAMLFDPSPDSILHQMGLRDAEGLNADYFLIMLSPFNDGLNAFCFQVFASDVQSDFKIPGLSDQGDDMSWDAVWQSKAKIGEKGWVVEIKIPYSAIRFPKTPVQVWGMNCQRDIRRYREVSSWNFVDSKISGYVNQAGLLEGIHDIKPPLRLSMMPYISGYLDKNPGIEQWQFSYNFGADLKYGITESFTLDMTLIPDFGQVPSDDRVFNFTPFEIRYDEKRQFFTEGTEMFNKGGIFYSRRIGTIPKGYDKPYENLDSNEIVSENPQQTRLINATKISGRTKKGLGIGLFNAMSANTWATVTDTISGNSRQVLTQGFTNYNMIVLDQNLKNNSYFDILNTNYYMPTEGYMANVSGIDFKFADKKYTYALYGNGFVSQKYYSHNSPDFGYHYNLSFGKISGNFKFNINQLLETDQYDPNDMGFNSINNRFNNSVSFQYNIYDPFWKVLNWYNWAQISYRCLYDGFKYTALYFMAETNTTTKKYLTLGASTEIQPIEGRDYYEPRVPGWMYVTPAYGNIATWVSTDYRKMFATDAWLAGYIASTRATSAFAIGFEPRLRASDRLSFIYELEYEKIFNDIGYVTDSLNPSDQTVIIFGRRDRQTISNVLEANLMITSSMSIDFRARHYWVTAPYFSFYLLQEDGRLDPVSFNQDVDIDFNLFNLDLIYIWNFAPGSQLSVMWKNAISTEDNDITTGVFRNLEQMFASPASNSFSIRILYYLDALYFKKKKKPSH
jgi:hypothetical protein